MFEESITHNKHCSSHLLSKKFQVATSLPLFFWGGAFLSTGCWCYFNFFKAIFSATRPVLPYRRKKTPCCGARGQLTQCFCQSSIRWRRPKFFCLLHTKHFYTSFVWKNEGKSCRRKNRLRLRIFIQDCGQ